jgi:hypothetical protein
MLYINQNLIIIVIYKKNADDVISGNRTKKLNNLKMFL